MPVGRSGMGVAVTMEPCPGSLPEEDEEEGDAMGWGWNLLKSQVLNTLPSGAAFQQGAVH